MSSTISQISSIGLLSKVQSKLSSANQIDGKCAQSKLWLVISSSVLQGTRNVQDDSPFATLFADAFRKRTRDLVQNSFVEALEAIKKQIRQVVGESVGGSDNNTQVVTRLGCVKFYDYFEMIHKKAADLDASDLQGVLVEEFLRTLLKLVLFFENEYPLQHPDTPNLVSSKSSSDEDKYLCISNILSAILAGFPERSVKLFPNMNSVSSADDRKRFARARAVFEENASDASVSKGALSSALKVGLTDRRAFVVLIPTSLTVMICEL